MATTLLTEEEYQQMVESSAVSNWSEESEDAHPLCAGIRAMRKAAGLSLAKFEDLSGIKAVVVGAYERGDRIPPLSKLDAIYRFFGYEIMAMPIGANRVRLTTDMVTDLRAMADQLEAREQSTAPVPGDL